MEQLPQRGSVPQIRVFHTPRFCNRGYQATSPSPRTLCVQFRQLAWVKQLTLGCFSQPAHPSLDEAFLVSLVDGYERPGKLIGVQPRGYSCGGVR